MCCEELFSKRSVHSLYAFVRKNVPLYTTPLPFFFFGRHIFFLKKRVLLLKRKKRYTFAQKVSFGVLSKSIPFCKVSFAQKYVVEVL